MPFAILPTSRRPLTAPTTNPTPTTFTYTFPSLPTFTHIVVFLLPDVILPEGTGAAVYLAIPVAEEAGKVNGGGGGLTAGGAETYRFLGALGPGKDSAVFRIRLHSAHIPSGSGSNISAAGAEVPEVDMDAPDGASSFAMAATSTSPTPQANPDITIGIAIEPLASIETNLATLRETTKAEAQSTTSQLALPSTFTAPSTFSTPSQAVTTPQIIHLASKILTSAYDHLASFATPASSPGGAMVPLKAFQTWWEKFERRLKRGDETFIKGLVGEK